MLGEEQEKKRQVPWIPPEMASSRATVYQARSGNTRWFARERMGVACEPHRFSLVPDTPASHPGPSAVSRNRGSCPALWSSLRLVIVGVWSGVA